MPDVFTRKKRSEVMSQIRGRGNKSTELRFIEVLRHFRVTGWRRHPGLYGNPDFVFRTASAAVFIDGCFWHGCRKCYRAPASNHRFWREKIVANKSRDRLVCRELRKSGWRVLRVWEHDLRRGRENRLAARVRKLMV